MTRRDTDETAKKQMEILQNAWDRDIANVKNAWTQPLSRRSLIGAFPGLAALPEVTAERAPDERLREALQRLVTAEFALVTLMATYEASRQAIWLALTRGDRPARLRALWLQRVAAHEEFLAGRRELAEAERRAEEAARIMGEG